MDWTDDLDTTLRRLWADGLTTPKIGQRMGITKNSVIGRARRLGLPARGSPIRKQPDQDIAVRNVEILRMSGNGASNRVIAERYGISHVTVHGILKTNRPRTSPRATLPPLQSRQEPPRRAYVQGRRLEPVRIVEPPAPPPVRYEPRPIGASCCWPIGEPRTPSFRFCDVPIERGKPYCEEHAKIAYERVRDRREDAAPAPDWRPHLAVP